MTTENFEVRAERAEDLNHIESLAERAFGPGRFARTAHRVREQGASVRELSLCAWARSTCVQVESPERRKLIDSEVLEQLGCVHPDAGCSSDAFAGSIQFTAVTIGGKRGALLLGPLMVESKWNGKGCGKALMEAGLARAREAGYEAVILVGDLPYYARFGFTALPPGQITMPGPVDPARLLGCELKKGALAGFEGAMAADGTA